MPSSLRLTLSSGQTLSERCFKLKKCNFCPAGPRPAFLASSVGPGQQFAGTAGQGTQAAQAVSNPNLQGQNIGSNTFAGGNGGSVSQGTFGALGKRKLQQAFFNNNPTGRQYPCAAL